MTTFCTVGCGQPADGMCSPCWGRLSGALSTLEWLAPELDITLARIKGGALTGGSSSTTAPLPVNLHASHVAHQLRNALSTWVRLLHDEHAVRWRRCDTCGVEEHAGLGQHRVVPPLLCPGSWVEHTDPLSAADTIVDMGKWLLRHPSWIRAHLAADELWDDLTRCIGACTRAIDTKVDRRVFLGICGYGDPDTCCEELYAQRGNRNAVCRACGDEWDVEERRAWMREQVRDEVATSATLSLLLSRLSDKPVTVKEIHRLGKIGAIIAAREDGHRRRYYRAGEVLDAIEDERAAKAG